MAKRWVIQKRLKMKIYRERQRGVKPRRDSEKIAVGPTPNKEVMQWYKNAAHGLKVPLLELYRYNREPVSQERQAVLDLRNKIRDACPEWWYFRLVDDSWLRARMYLSNDHDPERCCVIEHDPRRGMSRRSIVYRDRDVAYQRWCQDTMDWVEFSSFYHPNIPETFPSSD